MLGRIRGIGLRYLGTEEVHVLHSPLVRGAVTVVSLFLAIWVAVLTTTTLFTGHGTVAQHILGVVLTLAPPGPCLASLVLVLTLDLSRALMTSLRVFNVCLYERY